MPARPTQGGSSGSWGAALNANLDVSIDATTGALVPASVQTALAGAVTATGGITITADSGSAGSGVIVFMSGSTEMARIPNYAVSGSGAQYGPGSLLVGNDHSTDYGPQTGSPAGNVIPIRFQQLIGTAGVTVKQTTQAFAGWAKYKERTVDDSAEAASWGIILTDAYGGFTASQTLPAVAFEADAIAQGVTSTNKLISFTAGLKIQAGSTHNSTITTGIQFYGAIATVDASQTLTNWYGIYLETPTVNGTLTNKWALYAKDMIQTEGGMVVGVSGVQTDSQRVLFLGEGASAPTNATLDARMAASQTGPSITVTDSGGVRRGQWFGSTGNLFIGNAATGGSGNGILSMVTTTAPSGTPAANGGWLFVDPTDQDAKVITRNIGGTAGVTRRVGPSHEQILMEGLGYKSWAFDAGLGSGGTAPTSQTVYVRAVPLRANQIIANVLLETTTAAVGTAPTGMYVGIADSTGKMVAQSNNLNSSGIWTAATGIVTAPLNATYTVPTEGIYYFVLLQNGAFSVTQPAFLKGVTNAAPAGIGTNVFGTGATTGQTAPPANASNIAGGIVTTNGINYWFGAN